MAQPAKANEPSMEDILASIRRIIADDDSAKPPPQPPQPPPPPVAASAVAAAGKSLVSPSAAAPAPAAAEPPSVVEPPPAEVAASAPANGGAAEDHSADILDLTEQMAAPPAESAGPPPAFRTIDGNSDIGFAAAPERPASRPIADPPPRLMSQATSAAVDSAFNTLAQTVLVHNARTLEDLVREMLRPLLKSWLDENLPSMVERLVRAEIERVSRGR